MAPPNDVPSSAFSQACSPKTYSVRVMAKMSASISSTRWTNSLWVRACANTVAAMAPAEVAVTMSGMTPSTSTRYCNAPTSKDPLVPPPASTNAVFRPGEVSLMVTSLASG